MLRLYTTYYNEKNPKRKNELLACININESCNLIDEIILITENVTIPKKYSSKVRIKNISYRPKFQDIFQLVNTCTCDKDINIVANSDIYFDESLELLRSHDLRKKCLAITRWNKDNQNNFHLHRGINSQDTWIFQGKIKPVSGDFYFGLPGCDGRLAYEISRAGYHIENPAFDIKTYHLHNTGIRNYDKNNKVNYIPGPYKYPKMKSLHSRILTCIYRVYDAPNYLKFSLKYKPKFHFLRRISLGLIKLIACI
jgi:hypothetical protein